MTEFASIRHMDSLFYCSLQKSCLRLCKTQALPLHLQREEALWSFAPQGAFEETTVA
jgi:hypothetical protein